MEARGFTVEGSLRYGWSTFTGNPSFFVVLGLITAGIIIGAMIIVGVVAAAAKGAAGGSLQILIYVVEALILMGWVNITLKYTRGESAEYADIFQPMGQFLAFLITYVVFAVAVSVGTLFLIVPGIILYLRLQFAPFFLIDQQCGPIEALQRSWNATRGSTFRLFVLAIVLWFVNVIGALCLLVGLFATGPTTALATADVYTKIRDAAV